MIKEFLYQHKKIAYRIIGSGKPLILLHGFGEDGTVWNNQVEFLKNKFQLIIPDLPGSGQSEMIDDMSMEALAEVIKQIINIVLSGFPVSPSNEAADLKDSGNFSLIGHSMGGYVALAFAEKYPQYLHSFGLFHSTAYGDSEEKKAIRRKGIDFINQYGASEFLKSTTPNLFSPITKDEKPGFIDQYIDTLNNFSPTALVSYYEAMMKRPDRTDILRKTTMPVLFIMGEYDNAVPLQDGLKQCHLPGKSYIHILKQSGHMGMLEEAEKSNRILENFLLEI